MKNKFSQIAVILIAATTLLTSCEKNRIDETKDNKQVQNLIIEKYKKQGEVQVISSDLIILTKIETNRDQDYKERMGAPYQCVITSQSFIRLSDLKELVYSDVFNYGNTEKIINSIVNNAETIGLNVKEINRKDIQESLDNLSFSMINKNEFNFIEYEPIHLSCDSTIFAKNLPFKSIEPYLTDWFKRQFQ